LDLNIELYMSDCISCDKDVLTELARVRFVLSILISVVQLASGW
jgi:hypothetical protein